MGAGAQRDQELSCLKVAMVTMILLCEPEKAEVWGDVARTKVLGKGAGMGKASVSQESSVCQTPRQVLPFTPHA